MTNESNDDDFEAAADDRADAASSDIPRPLVAGRQHCLECCSGSALEVSLCTAKSCPLWMYRYGKKPTANILAEAGDRKIYPLVANSTVAEFHKNGGTALKAIKRRCLDCAGGSKSEVRDCQHFACDLYNFRLGRNPNRSMSPKQRQVAAARLQANVGRAKAAASLAGENFPTHVRKQPSSIRVLLHTELARRDRKSRPETALIGKK